MLRRCILGFCGFWLVAAAAPPPAIIDLTGDFVRIYEATRGIPKAERVARFKAEMARRIPGFYEAKRRDWSDAEYDDLIDRSFERFPKIEVAFKARAASVASQLADAQIDFARTFPDIGAMPPTYLLHSLGEMDGGTRELGGRTVLVFGADQIARVHRADANERPFFEHELFHVYHEPRFKNCNALWCSLWEEGFATYVAATLNPGAKPDELYMPAADLAAIKADPAPAACAVLAHFGSEDEVYYKPLFNGGSHVPGLPERAGYFIGFLVVQQLAASHDFRDLAQWSPAEAEPVVRATLQKLAGKCGPRQSRVLRRTSSDAVASASPSGGSSESVSKPIFAKPQSSY